MESTDVEYVHREVKKKRAVRGEGREAVAALLRSESNGGEGGLDAVHRARDCY